ncbi:MAG: glycosyltransferase family 39 protein [Deltaproteobacteria bacterium]|nr:glycosyltransferase family 39 protein [Deltaproteobacteria bacterium]
MPLLRLFIAVLIPTATGVLLISALPGEDRGLTLEKLCLGYGLGTGVLTSLMFLQGILRVPFTLTAVTAPQIVIIAALLCILYRSGRIGRVFPRANGGLKEALGRGAAFYISLFLLTWVLLRVSFVFYECLTRPVYAVDAWGQWVSGAKFFFYEKGLSLDSASPNYLGRWYRVDIGYPLHISLVQAWGAIWLGGFHESFVKVWSAIYYAGMLGIFWSAVRRESAPLYSLCWVFFLSGSPLLVYHGTEGLADLPLGYYGLASVLTFWRHIREGSRAQLILSGAFAGLALLTKNEGLFLAAGLVLAFIISAVFRKNGLSTIASFAVPFLAAVLPWLAFKAAVGLSIGHTGEEAGRSLISPEFIAPLKGMLEAQGQYNAGLHWEVLTEGLRQVFLKGANFNLIIPFWAILSAAGIRTVLGTELKYIYLVILAVTAGFVFIYLTDIATIVTEGVAIHRNVLTYAPILFFVSAALLERLLQGEARR